MTDQVSVIIPAFNEEKSVAGVVKVVQRLPEVGEIIVVSDGSTDDTAIAAREAGAKVIELPLNRGKGGAIAAGMTMARLEVIILLDADLIGLAPVHVYDLLKPVLTGDADMTVGIFSRGKMSTDLAQRFAPYLSGQRALRREAFTGIRLEEAGYGVEMAFTRWAATQKLKVNHVPLSGLTHTTKEKKRGRLSGIMARLVMYREIGTILIRGEARQTKREKGRWNYLNENGNRKKLRGWQIAVAIFVMIFMLIEYDLPYRRANAEIGQLTEMPASALGPRILVLSPHPDDETLGVGGIIQQGLARGSEIRVAFMTNGDGFRRGAEEAYDMQVLQPDEYIAYGQRRQEEALAAMKTLGLPRKQVTFLGYPDGGMATLWWNYWNPDRPYTSLYTRQSKSPYNNSYHPQAPYTAVAVLTDLEEIIREYQPTDIYLPHPEDTHPDHWATNAFAMAAVYQLEAKDPAYRPEILNYIIHRGAWQILPAMRSQPLLPPADVWNSDTRWYRALLPPEQVVRKKEAINQYISQMQNMPNFMQNFARSNEIMGILASKKISFSSGDYALNSLPWKEYPAVVNDPKNDNFGREAIPWGDLKSLYLVRERSQFLLKLDSWKRMFGPVNYRVALYVLPAKGGNIQRWVFMVNPGRSPQFRWVERPDGLTDVELQGISGKNELEVSLPVRLAGAGDRLMVGAETRLGGLVVDKTPWWVVEVPPEH
ncbi:MAG: PIG-L family deacetylase [Bacillota bacterium]